MTCGSVDSVTGVICGRTKEDLHVTHHYDDGHFEFKWVTPKQTKLLVAASTSEPLSALRDGIY